LSIVERSGQEHRVKEITFIELAVFGDPARIQNDFHRLSRRIRRIGDDRACEDALQEHFFGAVSRIPVPNELRKLERKSKGASNSTPPSHAAPFVVDGSYHQELVCSDLFATAATKSVRGGARSNAQCQQ